MTEIFLFGDRPTEMTPAIFAGLAPHAQTELARLMVERGLPRHLLPEALGLDEAGFAAIYRASHAFRLPSNDRQRGEDVEAGWTGPSTSSGRPKGGELSMRGCRLLAFILDAGGTVSISYRQMEIATEISSGAAKTAIGRLQALELIERVSTDSRGKITWQLTAAGRRAAEALVAGQTAKEPGDA